MRRLVVDGRWEAVEADVAPLLTRDLRTFQESIRRDGIRKVRGKGVLRHDCPVKPSVDAGKDCFAYRLEGQQIVPAGGVVKLKANYRMWVAYVDGAWQVITFEYDLDRAP